MADLGILSVLASQSINSRLALPFSGMLTIFIFKKIVPSGDVNNPLTLQQEELG